jgi:hypothetical protein
VPCRVGVSGVPWMIAMIASLFEMAPRGADLYRLTSHPGKIS